MGRLIGVALAMVLVGALVGFAYNWLPLTRSWIALALYSKFCVFAFFVNESLTLHLLRLFQGLAVWIIILAMASFEVVLKQELKEALALATRPEDVTHFR